jgi:DNA-binding response OmpR family regulator
MAQHHGSIGEPGARIIDVVICKLRKKLSDATSGEAYIHTD